MFNLTKDFKYGQIQFKLDGNGYSFFEMFKHHHITLYCNIHGEPTEQFIKYVDEPTTITNHFKKLNIKQRLARFNA